MVTEVCGGKKRKAVSLLFDGWQETMVWSCLQGVMGTVYGTVSPEIPGEYRAAAAVLGDFIFLAGRPEKELLAFLDENCRAEFRILVPRSGDWSEIILRYYGTRAKKVTRYAIKKEPDVFHREALLKAAESLPEGYSLCLMDRKLYEACREHTWSRDLVSQFETYEDYRRLGLGAVALYKDELVSGASSYTSYEGGIEIEIDTRKDHRRRGLAFACGARLILECLDRGLYPSWDAQNLWSVALAEKLGYHFDHEYTAFEMTTLEKRRDLQNMQDRIRV